MIEYLTLGAVALAAYLCAGVGVAIDLVVLFARRTGHSWWAELKSDPDLYVRIVPVWPCALVYVWYLYTAEWVRQHTGREHSPARD